jgi:hypothetical protein
MHTAQNDKKCDNFVELALVTNNGNFEFVENTGTYNVKSYLLCQIISFSTTANSQIAISRQMAILFKLLCLWSIYHRKSCKSQASCFDTLHLTHTQSSITIYDTYRNPASRHLTSWEQTWAELDLPLSCYRLYPLCCEPPQPDIWACRKTGVFTALLGSLRFQNFPEPP